MTASPRVLLVALVSSLLLTSCEDLDIFLDLFAPTDLAASDDPAVAAAAAAAEATEDRRDADQIVRDVVRSGGSATELDRARALRPDDSRIGNTQFYLAMIEGDEAQMLAAARASQRAWAATHDLPPLEDQRRWNEELLEVMADVLTQSPDPGGDEARRAGRDQLQTHYCQALDNYTKAFGEQPEAQLFLLLANPHGC